MVDVLSPSRSGAADVVADRANSTVGVGMLRRQRIKDNDIPDANVDHTAYTLDFSVTPAAGVHPLAVQFTAIIGGSGVDTFDWDFGDGTAHSVVQNPSHTYANAGSFTVTLKAGRAGFQGTNDPITTVKAAFVVAS
jgi:PKD repeat protein